MPSTYICACMCVCVCVCVCMRMCLHMPVPIMEYGRTPYVGLTPKNMAAIP